MDVAVVAVQACNLPADRDETIQRAAQVAYHAESTYDAKLTRKRPAIHRQDALREHGLLDLTIGTESIQLEVKEKVNRAIIKQERGDVLQVLYMAMGAQQNGGPINSVDTGTQR